MNTMIGKRVVFQYPGDYYGELKHLEGTILDRYHDYDNNHYPCDYYLIETDDGVLYSVRPFQVVKILTKIKNENPQINTGQKA